MHIYIYSNGNTTYNADQNTHYYYYYYYWKLSESIRGPEEMVPQAVFLKYK